MNDRKYTVNEIFYSIDGEGRRAGFPAVFIRFTGCNLRCSYCDTKYSYHEGTDMSFTEILREIKKYPCNNITVTGGEPLLQRGIEDLLYELKKRNYDIIVETNGSLDVRPAKQFASVCMDVKTVSSGCFDAMLMSNIDILDEKDVLKIVVKEEDLKWASQIIEKPCNAPIYISPVYKEIELADIADFVKRYTGKNKVRMQLQLHKYIWDVAERGV